MKTISRYIMTLALLITAVGGAWAQAPTIYFQQDYSTETVDWTTGTGGRYTPIIENGYLTVNQDQRSNNGATLTCTATQGKVDAGKDFTMTFNVKLGASNNQNATAFNIYDAANSAPILSFAEGSVGATAWKINGGTQTATVSAGGGKSLNELSWIFVQVTSIAGGKTYLTLKDDQNNIIDGFDKTEIPTISVAGGLGKMEFITSRYSANFAIDNVLVRDVEPEPTEWSLTPDETGKKWTLAEMPASNVELQVEYFAESNLFLGKEALADAANISVLNGETAVAFDDDGKSTTTVTEGNTVTAKFTGKKVLGMEVKKKAAAPAADIVWDATNVSDLNVRSTFLSYTKEGITLSGNATNMEASWVDFGNPETDGISFITNDSGGFTFTAPTGKAFTKIVMKTVGSYGWVDANLGTGWALNAKTVTWTGSAASTVKLLTGTDDFMGDYITSIAFYLSE